MDNATTVPSRVKAAAYAVPLCVLPSAAWRIGHVVDVTVSDSPCVGGVGESLYVVSLSVVSMSAALLTLGLVRRWGEVFPLWMPHVGGRPVPVRAATALAAGGAVLLGLITAYAVLNGIFGFVDEPLERVPAGCEPPGTEVAVLYAPLLAWAPLLTYVAVHYHRRASGGGLPYARDTRAVRRTLRP